MKETKIYTFWYNIVPRPFYSDFGETFLQNYTTNKTFAGWTEQKGRSLGYWIHICLKNRLCRWPKPPLPLTNTASAADELVYSIRMCPSKKQNLLFPLWSGFDTVLDLLRELKQLHSTWSFKPCMIDKVLRRICTDNPLHHPFSQTQTRAKSLKKIAPCTGRVTIAPMYKSKIHKKI